MKINFSWGTGLLMFIILFILAITGFFVFSSYQEYILVEEDYYEKEIEFQKQIDKKNRTAHLTEKITLEQKKDELSLRFPLTYPLDSLKGTLHFYRPSDSRLDVIIPIKPDPSGLQCIDPGKLHPGKFILKMDWEMNGHSYYQEHTLMIK